MRLWHKDLISVLPKNQLIGQWRECCAIAKAIAKNNTPNHILVNKIMEYPLEHFLRYTELIQIEMNNRGYNADLAKFYRFFGPASEMIPCNLLNIVKYSNLFSSLHNDRYLKQCYYNLQEKFDCGGISEEDWIKIKNKFEEKLNK